MLVVYSESVFWVGWGSWQSRKIFCGSIRVLFVFMAVGEHLISSGFINITMIVVVSTSAVVIHWVYFEQTDYTGILFCGGMSWY